MAGDLFMFFNKSKKYIDIVNTKGIFSNTYDERYPQTIVNQLVLKHFKKAEKVPKCIFIGWDGCRGDAMKYLIKSESEKISGGNDDFNYSAVNLQKKQAVFILHMSAEIRAFSRKQALHRVGLPHSAENG